MTNRTFEALTTLICVMIGLSVATPVARAANAAAPESAHPLIYLAGPLGFSVPGREYQDTTLIPALEHLGFRVFNPWKSIDSNKLHELESLPRGPARSAAWRDLDGHIGVKNVAALEACDIVFAVLDGADVDSGTAAEIGFAAARHKPIVGYRSDFRLASDNEGSVVNLQVEHFIVTSGGTIARSLKDADVALKKLSAKTTPRKETAIDNVIPVSVDTTSKSNTNPGAGTNADALEVVKFFSGLFTIVLALALGEAFKQLVSDKVDKPRDRTVHWNRLPTLFIFLVTIIPFFEGMNRLFAVKYIDAGAALSAVYPTSLIVDSAAFMIESILFFVMSRALSPTQIGRVIVTLFLLFLVDFLRDAFEKIHVSHAAGPWFWQNLVALAVLAGAYWWYRASKKRLHGSDANDEFNYGLAIRSLCVLAALALVRTVVDYYLMQGLYFPRA